ncbi:hypothetical protein A4X06_0g4052 [Tilletia controversa]|uniref:Uncharacterized protein n=2 Tax=Tilletia TaxID=13289 RepID=A0A8X7MUG4_9BASI|nr:hypothetical protein CF336_g6942 [Tilletia laevis]KAE8199156.1 hypothetical protein CF328_g3336 [Tilletia controversa]KAE8203911.1 hypothetical protein CF335_g2848 [Tilletia laevis]KAE8247966.1 hypothetical protein A4X06_0g4052 [Tilletia controversa]KAE8261422.1 hypothetical protein A4X03_0g3275 [Tilletia caries]
MCTGHAQSLHCPICNDFMTHTFTVEACPTIKHGNLSCCTTLSSSTLKVKDVANGYPCYPCRVDAPRREEEERKKAQTAKKAAKEEEEGCIARLGLGSDVDLVLHSAQYW